MWDCGSHGPGSNPGGGIFGEEMNGKNSLPSYIKKRVRSVLYKLKKERMPDYITIAMSGGKDSLAAAYFLKDFEGVFGYTLEAFFIDLGIEGFSSESKEVVKEATEKLGIKLHIIKPEKSLPQIIEENWEKIKMGQIKICATCGLIKRYIMNKFCWENYGEKGVIATGHNLDDELAFMVSNIYGQNVGYGFKGSVALGNSKEKLCSKIKPLAKVREAKLEAFKDVLLKKGFRTTTKECLLKDGNTQTKHKAFIHAIEEISKKFKTNNFATATLHYIEKAHKNKEKDVSWRKTCKICHYPTSSKDGICSYCKLMRR